MRRLAALLLLGAGPAVAAPDGAALYADNCAMCHQPNGEGGAGLAPPLAKRLAPLAGSAEGQAYLAHVVIGGMAGRITVGGAPFIGAMPSFARLDDASLAAVLTHVLRAFNGAAGATVTPAEVASARAAHPEPSATRKSRPASLSAS